MSIAALLARLGLFVDRGLLSDEELESLGAEMSGSRVGVEGGLADHGERVVDRSHRRTKVVLVPPSTRQLLERRLAKLTPRLAEHFELSLSGCEPPSFLVYGEGDYFRAHADSSEQEDAAEDVRRRQVSLVLFVNGASEEPAEGAFGGGSLVLYDLLGGGDLARKGLPLAPERGLAVAFRSDLRHEVLPVTFGERLSMVAWFF